MSQIQFQIQGQPDYSLLEVTLEPGQRIFAESSAMGSMDTNVYLKTGMKGGIWQSLKRGILTGESVFLNEFVAEGGRGEVTLAPGAPGEIVHYRLTPGKVLYLQSSAYLASSEGVTLETKWGGLKGFFSGTGMFLIKVTGEGDVFFNGFGGVIEVEIGEDGFVLYEEEGRESRVSGDFIIDTGYIAAFEGTLDYHVEFFKGFFTSIFGGELLVCRFRGSGKAWIQTKSVVPFASWVELFRPSRGS